MLLTIASLLKQRQIDGSTTEAEAALKEVLVAAPFGEQQLALLLPELQVCWFWTWHRGWVSFRAEDGASSTAQPSVSSTWLSAQFLFDRPYPSQGTGSLDVQPSV